MDSSPNKLKICGCLLAFMGRSIVSIGTTLSTWRDFLFSLSVSLHKYTHTNYLSYVLSLKSYKKATPRPWSGSLPTVSLALTWSWIYCKPGVCIPPWKWPKGSLGSGLFHWHGLKKKGFSQLFPDPQRADTELHTILSNTRSETGL